MYASNFYMHAGTNESISDTHKCEHHRMREKFENEVFPVEIDCNEIILQFATWNHTKTFFFVYYKPSIWLWWYANLTINYIVIFFGYETYLLRVFAVSALILSLLIVFLDGLLLSTMKNYFEINIYLDGWI